MRTKIIIISLLVLGYIAMIIKFINSIPKINKDYELALAILLGIQLTSIYIAASTLITIPFMICYIDSKNKNK